MKTKLMGRMVLATAVCGIFLLYSCAKSNSGSGAGGTGNGSFSVTIDGKTISGTAKDNNGIVIIAANPAANFDTAGDIFLTMEAAGDTIGFHIADRTGLVNIPDQINAEFYGVVTRPDTFFVFNPVQVHVSSLTASRITGTFAGTISTSLLLNQGTNLQMTNGTFDMPLIP
jgi:hypothetical protein